MKPEGLSKERIIEIARKNNGIFFVGPQHHNLTLRKKLNGMSNKGIFFHDKNWKKYGAYGDYYILKKGE